MEPEFSSSNEDPLDAGLRAAFGADPCDAAAAGASVLETLEAACGCKPCVHLRETAEDEAAPLLRPTPDRELRVPAGRGHYQVLGEIARGGMGVILKGHDTDLGRSVALKVLHEEHAKNPVVLQRFVEEAQIGGQLQHPGIVPVYEMGLMADERPYFTMKLVKGQTLASMLSDRRPGEHQLCRLLNIFEQVCQTLAYAHSRGVIHRDIKPANVMVGAFGEVQIVDWGLAKVLGRGGVADERKSRQVHSVVETVRSAPGSSGSESITGSVMGTPAYMPPEQAQGEVEKLDERADVFALGAILCEILTGAPPYRGEGGELLAQAAKAELGDALQRLGDCGADGSLVELTRRCLAHSPHDRPRNAREVAVAIQGYLLSVQERARDAELAAAQERVKAAEERKARRLTAALAASVLLTGTIGGGAWFLTEKSAAERVARTTAQVNGRIAQASLLRGQGDFAAAFEEARRAEAQLAAGEASEETRRRVVTLLETLEQEALDARAEEEKAARDARLLERMRANQVGDKLGNPDPSVQIARATEYGAMFREYGIDLRVLSDGDAVTAIRASGLATEIGITLDDWARCMRWADGSMMGGVIQPNWETPGSARLHGLAREVDPDPWRNAFRSALLIQDDDAVFALAEDERILDCPPMALGNFLFYLLDIRTSRVEALPVVEKLCEKNPDSWLLNVALGVLYLQDRRLEESLRYLYAARALEPESYIMNYLIAQTAVLMDDWDSAARAARLALEIDPGQAGMQRLLAQLEERVAADEGKPSGVKALDSRSDYDRLIQLQFDTGDFVGALELSQEALDRDPDWPFGYYLKGNALVQLERFGEAVSALRENVRLDPGHAQGHARLSFALYMLGRLEESVASMRRALDLTPRAASWRNGLAHVLSELEDWDGYIELYVEGIELLPDDAHFHNQLAWALLARPERDERDPERAFPHAQRAVELQPRRAECWNTLGVAQYRLGRYEEAVQTLKEGMKHPFGGTELARKLSAEALTGCAWDHYFLAMACQRLGREEEARNWYRRGEDWVLEWELADDREIVEFRAEARRVLGIEP